MIQRFYNVNYLGKTYYNILAYSEQAAIRRVIAMENEQEDKTT